MRLLLDTHALIWALRSPERLSETAKVAVAALSNDLFVSAATAYELSIKVSLGKLGEGVQVVGAFTERVRALGASELQITSADALLAGGLNWDHRDPFDRLLAAQALRGELHLVTRDAAFDSVPDLHVIW